MVAVTAVEPLAEYTLRLTFDDGSERVVDLADELWGPMGEPLRDPAYFRQVRVDAELRTVVWPNGFDLDQTSSTAVAPMISVLQRPGRLLPSIPGLTLSGRAGAL